MQSIQAKNTFTAFEPLEEVPQEEGRAFGVTTGDVKEKIYRPFKEAPPWRYIVEGLNMEAECQNLSTAPDKQCPARNKLVWLQKGFGEVDVLDIIFKQTHCPICKEPTKDVVNFGFLNCDYEITGKQLYPERKTVSLKDTAPTGGVTTFKPGEAQWVSLTIKTTKV